MPIYEYKCVDCESHFEKLQKASDESLTVCEKCNGKLEKQWSLSGFQFKGEGWYVTDYAKDKNKTSPAPSSNKDKSSESESTDTPKTASKDKSSEPAKMSKESKSKD